MAEHWQKLAEACCSSAQGPSEAEVASGITTALPSSPTVSTAMDTICASVGDDGEQGSLSPTSLQQVQHTCITLAKDVCQIQQLYLCFAKDWIGLMKQAQSRNS